MIAIKFLLTALAVNGAMSFSFLTKLPDHHINAIESSDLQKLSEPSMNSKYFISQRVQLNWIDAYTFCKANGLRLAKFSSSEDLKVLGENLLSYWPSFDREIIFDGSSLPEDFEASPCSVIDTKFNDTTLRNVSCTDAAFMFICEKLDEDSNNVETKITSEIDLKSTFVLKHVGDYVDEETSEIRKSYFVGGSNLMMKAAEAAMFCQSMDMVLASPENQEEYDNLRVLLKQTRAEWNHLQIELYLSEENKNVWMSRGEEINVSLSFIRGQPDNYLGKEDCLVFMKPDVLMNDLSCATEHQMLCEKSNHASLSLHGHQDDATKFVKHIASYSFESTKGLITKRIHSNQKFLQATWLEANYLCRSYGMDLFVPETDYEFESMKQKFEGETPFEEISKTFFIGATKLGSESWYSIVTGEPFVFDFNFVSDAADYSKKCAMLQKVDGKFVSVKVSCTLLKTNFFCQERFVKARVEDVVSEAVLTSESDNVDYNSSFELSWINVPELPLVEPSSDNDEPKMIQNPSACSYIHDIFDLNGNYLKTACQFSHARSYDEACVDLGMNLFIIDSPEVETQILAFATSIFGSGGGSTLWANGKEDEDGNWFTFDGKSSQELMPGIEGVLGSKWNNQFKSVGDCLILKAWGNFEVGYTTCNTRMYSFCEYKKTESIRRQRIEAN